MNRHSRRAWNWLKRKLPKMSAFIIIWSFFCLLMMIAGAITDAMFAYGFDVWLKHPENQFLFLGAGLVPTFFFYLVMRILRTEIKAEFMSVTRDVARMQILHSLIAITSLPETTSLQRDLIMDIVEKIRSSSEQDVEFFNLKMAEKIALTEKRKEEFNKIKEKVDRQLKHRTQENMRG